ncbi:hypothetical protein GCM10027423_22880 [Spirosoma arcticum]
MFGEKRPKIKLYKQTRTKLFRTTWAATKVLFAEKPVAFSGERLEEIRPEQL